MRHDNHFHYTFDLRQMACLLASPLSNKDHFVFANTNDSRDPIVNAADSHPIIFHSYNYVCIDGMANEAGD